MEINGIIRETDEFRVTDPRKPTRIIQNPEDDVAYTSIPALLEKISQAHPDHAALMYKNSDDQWTKITYQEYRDRVNKLAKVFIKLGLRSRSVVAVFAGNCIEWVLTELAAIHAGGIITGIYHTCSIDACFHILENSMAQFVVVDDARQMAIIRQIKHKLPHLEIIIQISPASDDNEEQTEGCWRWCDLMAVETGDVEDEYQKRLSEIAINECCCIIYTSGTTGSPKGAMITHDNFMFMAHYKAEELLLGQERFVSYLPLAHMAGQIYEIYRPMAWAATVYFGQKDAIRGSVFDLFIECRPTAFSGIPRIYEKLREKIEAIKTQTGFELDTPFNTSRIRKALGIDKIKRYGTGSAPLDLDLKVYLKRYHIEIMDTAGQTETTGVYCRTESGNETDSLGRAIKGVDVKIINQDESGNGEICVKGRCLFMGYLNDMERTIEALDDDGWLRTGDIGCVDDDKNMYITGRIKELVITSGGKNIPPLIIEAKVKNECRAISNAFLVGDRRKFLTMLITLKANLNPDGTSKDDLVTESIEWLESRGFEYTKISEILNAGPDPGVLRAIQEVITKVNETASSNPEKIQKFTILPQDFSYVTGEVTLSLKVKRSFVLDKYHDVIEKLYE